jgi:hypothetical protein
MPTFAAYTSSSCDMLSCSAASMRADTLLEGARCICTWTPEEGGGGDQGKSM